MTWRGIDGRGHARIADFGLAVPARDGPAPGFAGTVRFGLLSCAVLLFTSAVLNNAPLTLDWSMWDAGGSFAVLALFAALLAAAFYTSLAGTPVFGRALIED